MNLPAWFRFVGLPCLALAVVIAVTISLHRDLVGHEVEQIARIAESESYAARSRLAGSLDNLLNSLHDLHAFWTANGQQSSSEWPAETSIGIGDFPGIDYVLWSDPAHAVRFSLTSKYPALHYRPDDREWARYRELLERADTLDGDALLGPYRGDTNGGAWFIIFLRPPVGQEGGTLIARVDTDKAFAGLLADDSPGYAITVKWGDEVLYQRSTPGPRLPEQWTNSGAIRTGLGPVLEVTHTPTRELAVSLRSPAIDMVRVAGLLIAILMVVLLIETGRAARKARNASKAEQAVSKLNRSLEEQVRLRTQELADRSQDLVTITESVGHDLRNPLNVMSVNLQLLALQFGDALDADGMALLEKTSASLHSITEILDRLLELSHVFSSRFEPERIDMRQLVQEIFDKLLSLDPEPPAVLALGDLPDALAEPILVRTLLMNLLANALKYSRGESLRRIGASAHRMGQEVVYSVSDNGIGFDADASERMFKAFERLDAEGDGMGLGLDIVTRAVLRHNGRIWAEGKPGEGATFHFTLGPDSAAD